MPSPAPLQWLLNRLTRLIQTATDALEQQYPNGVEAWQQEVARQLARYHAAAMLVGAGVDTLDTPMTVAVTQDLAAQLRWLEKFGVEIQEGDQWERGWSYRAASYANSLKIPFWRGQTHIWPLPAMPAQGTQCMGNCGCNWEIDELDGEGNADAYWRRAKDDSCATCIQRETDWSPVKIRGGVLQL